MEYLFINFKALKSTDYVECDVLIDTNNSNSHSHRIRYYRNRVNGKLTSIQYVKPLFTNKGFSYDIDYIIKECLNQLDLYIQKENKS